MIFYSLCKECKRAEVAPYLSITKVVMIERELVCICDPSVWVEGTIEMIHDSTLQFFEGADNVLMRLLLQSWTSLICVYWNGDGNILMKIPLHKWPFSFCLRECVGITNVNVFVWAVSCRLAKEGKREKERILSLSYG